MNDKHVGACAGIEERIARLEAAAEAVSDRISRIQSSGPGMPARIAEYSFDFGDESDAVVAYGGRDDRDEAPAAQQTLRTWEEVIDEAGEEVASVLSALASGPRLRMVTELVLGPLSTSDLAERLDQPSTGQLFHHLKELLAVGIVYQPQRGVYTIRKRHLVPVLAILSAASDLAPLPNRNRNDLHP
jgi:DNA-binding transcriptional ArsR family regulator